MYSKIKLSFSNNKILKIVLTTLLAVLFVFTFNVLGTFIFNLGTYFGTFIRHLFELVVS